MTPPDVLIYIQAVKTYLEKNEDARKYFLDDVDQELFYRLITEFATKNFKKNGEVMLSQQQFETIRKMCKTKKVNFMTFINDNVFMNIGVYGDICLN